MSKPVVIVGGGLAGLACAKTLHESEIAYQILEASDRVGGHLKTDFVHGFTLDRGFQVYFDAYPNAKALLGEIPGKNFSQGSAVFDGKKIEVLDRGSSPVRLLQTALSPLITFKDKLLVLKWTSFVKGQNIEALKLLPPISAEEHLIAYGFSKQFLNNFARPFFGGVFLDRSLSVSLRQFAWVWKMLSSGETLLPDGGIEAIPAALASGLSPARIRPFSAVDHLDIQRGRILGVELDSKERFEGSAVVLAASARESARLLGRPTDIKTRSSICLYFGTARMPVSTKYLHLNGSRDGLINHVAPVSLVNPSYAPKGLGLVSVNILGDRSESDLQLAELAKRELEVWFPETGVSTWQFLRAYRIKDAQLAQEAGFEALNPKVNTETDGLFLAGEWTSNSSIDGAIESGVRAARRVITYLKEEQ